MSGASNFGVEGGRRRRQLPEIERFVTVSGFLRILAVVYLIAFCSFGVQAMGLIGSAGILTLADWLKAAREAGISWWQAPTVLWWAATDGAIRAVWIGGALAAAVAITGKWERAALAVCLVLWLSICTAGQEFLSFQWDLLLVETGLLAVFAGQSRVRVWLFRWLLFRLMFFSGVVKILSGDPTWRNLTAMRYHYETQPLPTPLAWWMRQLPMAAQKASTAFTLFAELLVPVLYFGTRPVRMVAAAVTVGLQLLILATGNYTFFNWLTIALCMWLLIEPRVGSENRWVDWGLAASIGALSVIVVLNSMGIPAGGMLMHVAAPFRIVNSYGLFAVMTTERPEIVVEGSADGVEWKAYEFRYKPGDLRRAPPVVAPHQPRLDWQMWFAALGSYQANRWFVNFMIRLLQGDSSVTRLLAYNPFPNAPPRLIRARLYRYRFTGWGSREWWSREEVGTYFPAVSLK